MTTNDYLQLGLYLVVLVLLVKPLGTYMALVFADAPNRVTRIGGPAERTLYHRSARKAASVSVSRSARRSSTRTVVRSAPLTHRAAARNSASGCRWWLRKHLRHEPERAAQDPPPD